MKNSRMLILILTVNILFFVSLIWWIWFTLSNFSLLGQPLNNKPAAVDPINKTQYYQIFPTPTPDTR